MVRARILFAAIALLLTSLIPPSAAIAGDPYIGFQAGVSVIANPSYSSAATSGDILLDPGYAVGFDLGYALDSNVRFEFNLSFREASIKGLRSGGTDLLSSGKTNALATMINVYYDFDLGIPIKPYVGAGVGAGFILLDSTDTDSILRVNQSVTALATNFMAGLGIEVTEESTLSLGYRYFTTGNASVQTTVSNASGSAEAKIQAHELILGLRYKF